MAASVTTSRAIYAGLSCGVAFAVPVCAYAVTLPFPAANGIVATCALPFTVGALAGVGLVTAMGAVADARADAHDEDTAVGEHEASHAAGAHGADEQRRSAHAGSRFFGKRGMPRDVPVIARASGAPSEEDAWAEIDALFSEDSPISCDAAHSKDIYEIAFEELRRNAAPAPQAAAAATAAPAAASAAPHHAAHADYASTSWQAPTGASAAMTGAPAATGAYPAAASSAAPQAWQAAPAASAATSTAMFMALAQQRAAAHAASAPANTNAYMPPAAAARTSAQATPTSTSYAAPAARAQATAGMSASSYVGAPARPMAQPADAADAPFDRDADARAALASLDRFGSERLARPVTGSMPAQAAAAPATPATSGAWATNPVARPAAAAAPVEPSVPAAQPASAPADAFADRRSVWAAALDILAEPEEPVRPAPATTAASARRASAIAEGKRANRMHEHVNELIEQELGQVASPAVQHSSREYLRVIQGGTASMPALQAEA